MNWERMERQQREIGIKYLSVKKCHKKIHLKGAPRIYTTMKVNTRTDKEQKFSDKVKSVLDK